MNHEAGDRNFKTEEALPNANAGQQPAVEPPADALTGQPAPPSPAPQAESQRVVKGVFKTPFWVIEAIEKNQRDAEWWTNRDPLVRLRKQCEALIHELDLRVKDDNAGEMLGVPLIKIEPMNVRTLGTYRSDVDGYAIGGTIVLNQERLWELEPFMEAALMLTLLVRARQHQRGGDGRLDREGRDLMKSHGLVVTEKGKITIAEDGAFRRFLEEQGIEVPVASVLPRPARQGRTTLQLWSCTCQSCRVGTKVFLAVCEQCKEPFRLGDHRGKRFVQTGACRTA
jgi:hypothetical protein